MKRSLDPEDLHSLSKLFETRFTLLGLQVDGEQYKGAFDTAYEMLEDISDLIHSIRLKQEMYASATKTNKPDIDHQIKVSRRHLGELEDWVHINRKDLQLGSLYHLEESVSELAKLIRAK